MTKAILPALFLVAGLVGCSSAPEPATTPAPAPKATAPAPPPNHTSIFPDAGKVSATVVPNHILDMKSMPGGSLAEYTVKGKSYKMFIIDVDSNQAAAFLLLDMKGELQKDPEYLANFGGYSGMYGDQPIFCFAKLHYLAGVVGLPKAKAEPIAVDLAAQLH